MKITNELTVALGTIYLELSGLDVKYLETTDCDDSVELGAPRGCQQGDNHER